MQFQKHDENRAVLVMTRADRVTFRLCMLLQLLLPLIIGGALYLSDRTEIGYAVLSAIFTAGMFGMRIRQEFTELPAKLQIDPDGLTRELFWTGRREHLALDEISAVKRHDLVRGSPWYYVVESTKTNPWIVDCRGLYDWNGDCEDVTQFLTVVEEIWTKATSTDSGSIE